MIHLSLNLFILESYKHILTGKAEEAQKISKPEKPDRYPFDPSRPLSLSNLLPEINPHIFSFLDRSSIFSLRMTCKSLRWRLDHANNGFYNLSDTATKVLVEDGHLQFIKNFSIPVLKQKLCYTDVGNAATYGHLDILKWILSYPKDKLGDICTDLDQFPSLQSLCNYAAQAGHFHILDYMWETFKELPDSAYIDVPAPLGPALFKWISPKSSAWKSPSLVEHAIYNNDLARIKLLFDLGVFNPKDFAVSTPYLNLSPEVTAWFQGKGRDFVAQPFYVPPPPDPDAGLETDDYGFPIRR